MEFQDLTQRFLRRKILLVVLAVIGFLWFLGANYSPATFSPSNRPNSVPPEPAKLDDAPRNQIVVRSTSTNAAGLGSVVAQLRSSVAFATILGATVATFPVISTHITQYQAASLLHIDRMETPLDAGAKVCALSASPIYGRIPELVDSWCDNATLAEAQALELREGFKDCGLILDDRPWDVRYEYSKCTWRWVRHVFSRLGLKKRNGGIGLHIRWGDMSVETPWDDPLTPERSTPIAKGAELLRKLRECGVRDELSVYMEWHNATLLRGLGEPYRLVDTGDSVDDLLDLASNRLMILDISSWTILAHQITDGGLTVIPDGDSGFNTITWADNGPNHVLRWQELLNIPCSDLSALLSS